MKTLADLIQLTNLKASNAMQQCIVVTTQKNSINGKLYLLHQHNNAWDMAIIKAIDVVIGRDGATDSKYEGDHKTPLGLYKIAYAFGKLNLTDDIIFPYEQLTSDDKFIDDSTSLQYNTWVRGDTTALSYETMLRPDGLYDIGLVIEYNMQPVIADRGSAIFIHIWRNAQTGTEGCIAMDKDDLMHILCWLNPESTPHVLIIQDSILD